MSNPLTLEGLQVLDAIERKGSFAAAAASLYRVPSKVTYTVSKMEQDLGITLFRKQGRRSILTPAGRALLEGGRELLHAADRLAQTAIEMDRGWEASLSIGLDSVLQLDFLHPALAALHAQRPDIEVQIYDEVLGGSWEAITQERVDLVVGAPENEGRSKGLQMQPLLEVEWVYAVAPSHPLAKSVHVLQREELLPHRAVVVRDSSRNLPAVSQRIFDTQPTLRVATMQQKIEAQRLGHGIGYLPRFRVQHLLDSGELVALSVEDVFAATPLYMAWRCGKPGKALSLLIEHLTASAVR